MIWQWGFKFTFMSWHGVGIGLGEIDAWPFNSLLIQEENAEKKKKKAGHGSNLCG
ncbi:hypothetical protein HanIR_Chr01g0047371 [Helianthus annuus]|nr:hypothetical protein HanIR_Chr01g0047371 [Helianthus annuus]